SLGRFHALHHNASSQSVQAGVFLRRQFLTGKDHDRQVVCGRNVTQLLQYVESRHIGETQVEHHAVEGITVDVFDGIVTGTHNRHVDVIVTKQLFDTEL